MRLNRNPIVRKGIAALKKIPRAARRITAFDSAYLASPPILANSFPKSGTHLLSQVLSGLPDAHDYATFWASVPSIRFTERSVPATVRMIEAVAPGEVVRGHLHHHSQIAVALEKSNVAHFLIYRDLRDVVVSEANYLAFSSPWHRLHRFFHELQSDEERIALAIRGLPAGSTVHYPNIADRFARFAGWLYEPAAVGVRYEDLVGENRSAEIRRLVTAYAQRQGGSMDIAAAAARAEAAIVPEKSHTYRRGIPGGWRNEFTPQLSELMKQHAGDLLIRLRYELDLEW